MASDQNTDNPIQIKKSQIKATKSSKKVDFKNKSINESSLIYTNRGATVLNQKNSGHIVSGNTIINVSKSSQNSNSNSNIIHNENYDIKNTSRGATIINRVNNNTTYTPKGATIDVEPGGSNTSRIGGYTVLPVLLSGVIGPYVALPAQHGVSQNGKHIVYNMLFLFDFNASFGVHWSQGAVNRITTSFDPNISHSMTSKGSAAVGELPYSVLRGYYCPTPGSNENFRLFDPLSGYVRSVVRDVSSDGSMACGASLLNSTGNPIATLWTNRGPISLGTLGTTSEAFAMSGDGSVVVGYTTTTGEPFQQAFRWTANTGMVGLGYLGSSVHYSTAWDVSTDGLVIVGGSLLNDSTGAPFKWTSSGGLENLGRFSNPGSIHDVRGVNGNGSLFVGIGSTGNTGNQACVWTPSIGIEDLKAFALRKGGISIPSNHFLSSCDSVSNNGKVFSGQVLITHPDTRVDNRVYMIELPNPINTPL